MNDCDNKSCPVNQFSLHTIWKWHQTVEGPRPVCDRNDMIRSSCMNNHAVVGSPTNYHENRPWADVFRLWAQMKAEFKISVISHKSLTAYKKILSLNSEISCTVFRGTVEGTWAWQTEAAFNFCECRTITQVIVEISCKLGWPLKSINTLLVYHSWMKNRHVSITW